MDEEREVASLLVPGAGLEPARGYPREILSLLRLPISPSGHVAGASERWEAMPWKWRLESESNRR